MVLAPAVLAADLLLPLGVAGAVLYVVPVLLTLPGRPRETYTSAAVCSAFTVVGLVLSPPGGALWVVLANRAYALLAIWVTALLVVRWGRRAVLSAQQQVEATATLNARLEESEARLREQRDELDQLYRTAPIGLAVIDRDFRYLRVNDQLASLLGSSAAEIVGRRLARSLLTVLMRPSAWVGASSKQVNRLLTRSGPAQSYPNRTSSSTGSPATIR